MQSDAGPDSRLQAVDNSGKTLLHDSVSGPNRNLELVLWLIDQGIDPDAKDKHGRTMLHYLAGATVTDVTEGAASTIKKAAASPEALTKHAAQHQRSADIARMLLTRGTIAKGAVDSLGRTALDCAIDAANRPMTVVLEEFGAKLGEQTQSSGRKYRMSALVPKKTDGTRRQPWYGGWRRNTWEEVDKRNVDEVVAVSELTRINRRKRKDLKAREKHKHDVAGTLDRLAKPSSRSLATLAERPPPRKQTVPMY